MQGNLKVRKSGPATTIVETAALTDPRLGFAARGIYAYYCTLPVGSVLDVDTLVAAKKSSTERDITVIAASLAKLVEYGYLSDSEDA